MYAVKIKQVTFGLSYHIGCPVVRAYVRSRGNQKFTPDFLTHCPGREASVNDSYQLLNKFEQILWFVNGEYINSFRDAEGKGKWLIWATVKITVLKVGLLLPGNRTTFSTVLCFFQKFSLDRPMFHIRCKWTFWKRFENGKKPWDGQYYSKTGYLCSKTNRSFYSAYVIGSYLQVTQWYLDQSRIWK